MAGIGSSRKYTSAARAGVLLRIGTLLAMVGGLLVSTAAGADAATGLDVYVGYMDTHTQATSTQQPNPWPYTDSSRYVGTPCPNYGSTNACWDASALMLKNNGDTDVTGIHVVVMMGTHKYDLWGPDLRVAAHDYLVLTETGSSPNSENFDGSDFSPNAYNGGLEASCIDSGARPTVSVTIGGATTSYSDTGQVLNAGGVDGGHCVDGVFVPGRMDESHPWVLIGTAPAGGGGGGTAATAPAAPTNLKATAGDGSVKLTWTAPADGGSAITGYRVLRATTRGGESILTTVSSTGFTDTGVTNGTTYYYTVVAVNGTGPSPQSNEASATPQPATPSPTAPSAPTNLTAMAGDGSVSLSWTAPSGGSAPTSYNIYRGATAGGESSTPVKTVTSTGFTDTAVTNGTTYYYTVAAVNGVGPSPQSNEASATPQATTPPPGGSVGGSGGGSGPTPDPGPSPVPQPSPPTAPSAPAGLAASVVNGAIRLTWSAPTSDGGSTLTGYQLYRGTTGGGEAATPVTTGIVTTTFTDTDVRPGTTYFYTVAAVNAVGTSAPSAEASAQVSSPNRRGICAGLARCHVTARADVNGDGHRDVIAMARRGGRLGSTGAVILRVKTGPHHVVQTRRRLENWSRSPWVGVARLDRRPGKEIVLGRLSGAAATFYQSITWRRGHLVLLDAPGRGRWWPLDFSATLQAGWQRRAADPVGTIRQRIATHPGSDGTYLGRIKVYRWTRSGWHLVRARTNGSVPLQRVQRWGGFHVPGLPRF